MKKREYNLFRQVTPTQRQKVLHGRVIANLEIAETYMKALGYGAELEDLQLLIHRVKEDFDR